MKFRSYVISAITATAIIPFAAWSLFQWSDIEKSLETADREQRFFTGIGSAFIAERLQGVETFAAHAESRLEKALADGAGDLDAILTELAGAQPYIRSLELVPAGIEPAEDDENGPSGMAWRVVPAEDGDAPAVAFSVELSGAQSVRLVGTLDARRMIHDIADMFDMRGVRFGLLDEKRRFIWPAGGFFGDPVWRHPSAGEGLIAHGDERYWMTAKRITASFPSWTMVALTPQAERTAERDAMLRRTLALGGAILLLAALAGSLALSPLLDSLRRIRRDLDDAGYAADANTILRGPEEFKEFQEAYRALRIRLDDRHRSLLDRNEALEETVQERSIALADQEGLFAQVFADIQEGMLLLDESLAVRHANPAARAMLGGDALMRFAEEAGAAGTEDDAAPRQLSMTIEGRPRIFECALFPVGASARTPKGFCLLFRDVTGKAELERMKDDLISIVAHELRTPVTACRLQLDLLAKAHGGDPAVEAMRLDLEHLAHIIDDWLAVAKIDGGAFTVAPEVVQILPLAAKALRLVRSRYEFSFASDIAEEAECVFVDPNAFIELLVNLFTNACRYARKGALPQIEFSARLEDGLVVEVADRGVGFSPEQAERIFDRFHQLEAGNRRRTGGTGLGLVICRAICEAHGGSISARCADGRTVFEIRLPNAPAAPAPLPETCRSAHHVASN